MSVTAALLASTAAGAAGGLSSFFGGKDKGADFMYDYHPLDESFKQASQWLIPIYLKLLTGGTPNFMKRYLSQAQSAALTKANQTAQSYLRQAGRGATRFGPQQMEALSKIYQGVTPSIVNAMNQMRNTGTQQAMTGMQQWSQMRPQQTGTREVQPGMGPQAAAGALQGVQYGMGQITQGSPGQAPISAGNNPARTPITTVPAAQQVTNQLNPYMPQATQNYIGQALNSYNQQGMQGGPYKENPILSGKLAIIDGKLVPGPNFHGMYNYD
jgi:hypothetical protein